MKIKDTKGVEEAYEKASELWVDDHCSHLKVDYIRDKEE